MTDLFEIKLQRSAYKHGFENNQDLPEKYYRVPLCNVKIDYDHSLQRPSDNDYTRCHGTKSQLKELGYDIKTTFDVSKVNELQNKDLWEWAKAWVLKNPLVTLNVQSPGQQFPFHMDGTESYNKFIPDMEEKRKRLRRVFIMLEPWSPGQIIVLGTKTITHWNKGDVLWFDWYHVPHGTANFSRAVRPLLQITGETTPEFEKLFV